MKMQKKWKQYLAAAGVAAGVFLGMKYLLPLLLPFLAGLFLAVLVLPAARQLEKKFKISRSLTGAVMIFALLVLIGWILIRGASALIVQTQNLFEEIGVLAEGWEHMLDNCCNVIERYAGISSQDTREFLLLQFRSVSSQLKEKFSPAMLTYLLRLMKGSIAAVTTVVISYVFAVLLVKDLDEWNKKLSSWPALVKWKKIWQEMLCAGGRYFKAQIIIMAIISAACMGGLFLLKNPYYLIVGILIGFLDALPFIGTGTVLIPWAAVLLLQGEAALAAGYFLLFVTTAVLREFLEPKLIGGKLGIAPAAMLISVYLGIIGYGVSGVILGPLTLMLLQAIFREWGWWRERK